MALGEFCLHPSPLCPLFPDPGPLGGEGGGAGTGGSSSSRDEVINVGSSVGAARRWPWLPPLLWEFGGVGAGQRAGRQTPGETGSLWKPPGAEPGEGRGRGLPRDPDRTFDNSGSRAFPPPCAPRRLTGFGAWEQLQGTPTGLSASVPRNHVSLVSSVFFFLNIGLPPELKSL